MTVQITERGKPLDQLKAELAIARKELSRHAPVLKQVSVYLDQWVQRNFQTSGGKAGGWKPFALGGRFRNGKLDTSAKLLMDTGRLRLSFFPGVRGGTAFIRSDLPYAAAHNEGTSKLPQRRILPVESEVRADVNDIIARWMRVSFKKAGL